MRSRTQVRVFWSIALLTLLPGRAVAQQAAPRREAFAVEALGGMAGSLAGIAIVGLTTKCGVDDLACIITKVGAGGALGAVGATAGTIIAARAMRSPNSIGGALLGSVVGTGAGLGAHWLFNRASDRNLGDAIVVPIFVVAQGVFAALGSRALAR